MKKIALFISSCLFAMTTITSYAYNSNYDAKTCTSYAGENLTVCYQNLTNESLSNYKILALVSYNNATYDRAISNIIVQPNHFIDLSTSSLDFKKDKVAKYTYAIVKGVDINNYQIVPGCTVEMTVNTVSKSLLTIHKNGEYVYCE